MLAGKIPLRWVIIWTIQILLIGLILYAWFSNGEWPAAKVFERAFDQKPPAGILSIQSKTYPTFGDGPAFYLRIETDAATLIELLAAKKYSAINSEHLQTGMLSDERISEEFPEQPKFRDSGSYYLASKDGYTNLIRTDADGTIAVIYLGRKSPPR